MTRSRSFLTHPVGLPLALALGAAVTLPAHAGRPLQTDDAGVLDRRACELEGYTARLTAAGATARDLVLQAGCGVGAGTQLAVALSRASAEGERVRGIALNGKTRLWQGEAQAGEAPALTLGYAAVWDRSSGQGWRHAGVDAKLLYTRALAAHLMVHANLGHARDAAGGRSATTWGLAFEHAGFGGLAPMAELFGDDREAPWWNLGLRWTVAPEALFIDVSHGRQVAPGTPRLTTLGMKFSF